MLKKIQKNNCVTNTHTRFHSCIIVLLSSAHEPIFCDIRNQLYVALLRYISFLDHKVDVTLLVVAHYPILFVCKF